MACLLIKVFFLGYVRNNFQTEKSWKTSANDSFTNFQVSGLIKSDPLIVYNVIDYICDNFPFVICFGS